MDNACPGARVITALMAIEACETSELEARIAERESRAKPNYVVRFAVDSRPDTGTAFNRV